MTFRNLSGTAIRRAAPLLFGAAISSAAAAWAGWSGTSRSGRSWSWSSWTDGSRAAAYRG
jgi:hypothetical protein